MKYSPDNYGGVALGIIFMLVGGYMLSQLVHRSFFNRLRDANLSVGRFEKIVPLRRLFPAFACFWVLLLSFSTIGLGAVTTLDNLIYADTHHHQSGAFVLFWIPYAFCLGTAGLFGSKENFRTQNPVGILFTRFVFGIFVVISIAFACLIVAHFNGVQFATSVKAYIADVQNLVDTGKPLS